VGYRMPLLCSLLRSHRCASARHGKQAFCVARNSSTDDTRWYSYLRI